MGYQDIWTRDEDLDSLNARIHDGVPVDQLYARAAGYVTTGTRDLFEVKPEPGARVLEIGSGVGWPMQATLDAHPGIGRMTGLDISKNMIDQGRRRFAQLDNAGDYADKIEFVRYDGRTFPFEDDSVDFVYSYASLQHIPKEHAYFVFREAFRVLSPGATAVLHYLSVRQIPQQQDEFEDECRAHVEGVEAKHWHFFYSFEELWLLFDQLIGVSDLDIRYVQGSAWVSFTKATPKRPPVEHVRSILGCIDDGLGAVNPYLT